MIHHSYPQWHTNVTNNYLWCRFVTVGPISNQFNQQAWVLVILTMIICLCLLIHLTGYQTSNAEIYMKIAPWILNDLQERIMTYYRIKFRSRWASSVMCIGDWPTNWLDHIRDIFYRMGWSDQEIVALSGAHALGRCHPDRSGFKGPWTPSPTLMTNDYFKRLLDEKYYFAFCLNSFLFRLWN